MVVYGINTAVGCHFDRHGFCILVSKDKMISEPRYNYNTAKSTNKKQRVTTEDKDVYANSEKVSSRGPAWNFPSSSDEDDEEKRPGQRLYARQLSKNSSTSEEGERPLIPPKLWAADEMDPELRRSSSDSGIRESSKGVRGCDGDAQVVTIEYNSLRKDNSNRKGSLIGADDDELPSPTLSRSSGFGDNNDIIDGGSVLSENSSKLPTDYEQSSACVDMDQLSLDSYGKRPKRIVETHETHEIVQAEDADDDVVERIIETQTITEKLDEDVQYKEYGGEDFSKYLEDDDEFVSHIFSLGRTLEKGNGRMKSKDFAFVENPFSQPEPMIETTPIEKKTVKQKITTLVKKKKNKDDDNIYAEVQTGTGLHSFSYAESKMYSAETDAERSCNGSGAKSWDHAQPKIPSTSPPLANKDSRSRRPAENVTQTVNLMTVDDADNKLLKVTTTDKKKDPKTEKRSLLKGFKKLWKRKDKEVGSVVMSDDDYQEFVP